MVSVSIRPVLPALQPFVAAIHYTESAGPSTLERVLPGARIHVMVNLFENEFRTYHGPDASTIHRSHGAVLQGAASYAHVIDTRLMRSLVTVDFTVGGAAAFFKMPLAEAHNELVDLDHVWGVGGRTLRERLLEEPTPDAKLRTLERVLMERLVRRDEPDRAVACAAPMLERGVAVAEVSARIGISQSTLVRRFRAAFGLTPKRFSRVKRLQRVVSSVRDSPDVDWCDVAAVHGYVDQAHLVHDFREIAGITPTAYRPRAGDEFNHVPVDPG